MPTATSGQTDLAGLGPLFFGQDVSVSTSPTELMIKTTNFPEHLSAYFPTSDPRFEANEDPDFQQAPNIINSRTLSFRIPRFPSETTDKVATPLGPIGISRNGVPFYNQFAGGGQPLSFEIESFDQNNGHPDPMGQYHYHLEPTEITDKFGKDAFVGVLLDGFPVYGPEENGKVLTNADLDAQHGHFGPTKEFPNGVYHYHFTAEAPYLNGGNFFGTPGLVNR